LRLRLAALAGRQSGYFTAAQARSVGYSYQAQKFHTDRGNWLRIDRGIFRLPEWPTAVHDNLVRSSLWARGLAIVSHDTALSVHDLGDANPLVVHVPFHRTSARALPASNSTRASSRTPTSKSAPDFG
jgi:predicted transcriptional regulator of viral defense system